jgi:hypothetical protein
MYVITFQDIKIGLWKVLLGQLHAVESCYINYYLDHTVKYCILLIVKKKLVHKFPFVTEKVLLIFIKMTLIYCSRPSKVLVISSQSEINNEKLFTTMKLTSKMHFG